MYFFGLFYLVVSLSLVVAKDTVKYPETKSSILGNSPSFSSSCGGILNANTGVISYKQFDLVEPNEVCIWIVRAPNATRYTGIVANPENSSTIIISSFGHSSGIGHMIPFLNSASAYDISASVLIITFTSSNNTDSRGFHLTFSAGVTDSHIPDSSTSEVHLVSANSGLFRYPTGKAEYGIYETSIFVFEPVRNEIGQLQKTQVLYIKDELEGTSCADALDLFKFNRSGVGVNQWTNLGRICGNVDSATVSNQDFIMIYFRSDGSVVKRGFHLYAQTVS